MQDKKSSQWKKPPLTSVSTSVQPLSAQWDRSVGEGFTDRMDNCISFGLYPDIPSLCQSHPFPHAHEDPTLLQHSPESP